MRAIRNAWLFPAILLLAAALALACGGDDGEPTATSTPDATETPEPAAPSEADTQLSLTVEGDFVAPDSHAFRNRFEVAGLSGTRDAVVIGDAAWYREGDGEWTETTRNDPEVVDLVDLSSADPDFLQDQEFVQELRSLEGEPETINGVDTTRYFIPRETIATLAELFGGSFLEDTGGLTDFEMTVWLEEQTGGLVRAVFDAAGSPELFGDDAPFEIEPGSEVTIALTIDLSQINEDIVIEPPVEGATAPAPAGDGGHPFESFHYTVDVEIGLREAG